MTVTVYSKPACVQCTATIRALDAAAITYTVVDLTADLDAMTFVQELGYRQAPVIVTEDKHWSGYRPDMIAAL